LEVNIFDVEHGGCAAVITPSGHLMMIDAGHNGTTGWRPSDWVKGRHSEIESLVVTNFDEDHVTDLPNLFRTIHIRSWVMNWNVTAEWVRREKAAKGGMGLGVARATAQLAAYRDLPKMATNWGCDVRWFYHPVTTAADENYLSVVTFIHCGDIRIVFGGDLTAAGWRDFLRDPLFVAYLRTTNIFVASHHGREDGYCPEVFDYCRPDVVIASDKSVEYETQLVDYGQHASGIVWNGSDRRCCLTTRKDGTLTITPKPEGSFFIRASG
jgi:beta-lactamase superfamily II metal-dependent hydrolase